MYRLSALLACLLVAGCGVQLRTPPPPIVPAGVPITEPRPNPVLPIPSVDPLILAPGQTVVSITFDDGRMSNSAAAKMLVEHGLRGTFFINSGNIGKTGYLSLRQLDAIAVSGNEIAGHTLDHQDLATLTPQQAVKEICDDRNNLIGWGYRVRNFAYPFASANADLEDIVHNCGYNSARSLGETKTFHVPENAGADNCSLCDVAETVPPGDPYYTKAPAQVRSNWSPDDFQQEIGEALTGGGGWIQLTFHGLCPTDCSDITTPVPEFAGLLDWLADQQTQGNLIVRTVGDVIGGDLAGPVPWHP